MKLVSKLLIGMMLVSGFAYSAARITNSDVSSTAAIAFSKMAGLTADRVLVSSAGGVVTPSSIPTSYLDPTSSIQTQLDGMARLVGRSSGQTLFGGSATGQNLILRSNTSNNGVVSIGDAVQIEVDEGNQWLNIGGQPAANTYDVQINATLGNFSDIGLMSTAGQGWDFFPDNSAIYLMRRSAAEAALVVEIDDQVRVGDGTANYKMSVHKSSTDTTPLSPAGAIIALRNLSNTANNYSCVLNESQGQEVNAGMCFVNESHTGGSSTGHVEVIVASAGVMAKAAQFDADLDAHFYADADVADDFTVTGNIRAKTNLELEDPGAGTNVVSLEAVAGTVEYKLTLPVSLPTANQVLSVDSVVGNTVSLEYANNGSGSGGGLWGIVSMEAVTNCRWGLVSQPNNSDFGADSDCSDPVATDGAGDASAPATKIPAITFANMEAGIYKFTAIGDFIFDPGAGNVLCAWRFSDGTRASGNQVSGNNGTEQDHVPVITGYITYPTDQANQTIKIQSGLITGASGNCDIANSLAGSSFQIIVEKIHDL